MDTKPRDRMPPKPFSDASVNSPNSEKCIQDVVRLIRGYLQYVGAVFSKTDFLLDRLFWLIWQVCTFFGFPVSLLLIGP